MVNMDEVEVRLKAFEIIRDMQPSQAEREKGKKGILFCEGLHYADQIAAWLMSGKLPSLEGS